MARPAFFLLAAILLIRVAVADGEPSPRRLCTIELFNQAKAHFWPALVIDYSLHGDVTDSEVTHLIDSGVGYGQLFIEPMKRGRTEVSNVALAAPAERLRSILHTISVQLAGERLPYLVFLLMGPQEMRNEARTLIEGLGATFIFVPYEDHCNSPSVNAGSGRNSGSR
jgi:hypothetical protein